MKDSAISVTIESLENLYQYWHDPESGLVWNCLFIIPPWLKSWQSVFGAGYELCIYSFRYRDKLVGIAPLMVRDDIAYTIGDMQICDYGDLVFRPGNESLFISSLLDYLRGQGIRRLEIGSIRQISPLYAMFRDQTLLDNVRVECKPAGRTYHLELPRTWEGYLSMLTQKDRHEVRRKLRRLNEAGNVKIRILSQTDEIDSFMNTFIKLFQSNIPAKRAFMTGHMELFFRKLAHNTSEEGIARILILMIDGASVAATLCFDFMDSVYLYNNGYDRSYAHLSVGLMSKVFAIKNSIDIGRRRFDFLKGDESYKRYLGGVASQLYDCSVIFV